jgi:plastocyanin
MRNRFSFLALALLVAVSLVGCGDDNNVTGSNDVGNNGGNNGGAGVNGGSSGSGSPSNVDAAVFITGVKGVNSFFPSTVTVRKGQVIEWRNNDNQSHFLVSDLDYFATGNIQPGTSSSTLRIAMNPGAYHYHCVDHPRMVGSILVTP